MSNADKKFKDVGFIKVKGNGDPYYLIRDNYHRLSAIGFLLKSETLEVSDINYKDILLIPDGKDLSDLRGFGGVKEIIVEKLKELNSKDKWSEGEA